MNYMLEKHDSHRSIWSKLLLGSLILLLAGLALIPAPLQAQVAPDGNQMDVVSSGVGLDSSTFMGTAAAVRSGKWIEVILSQQRINAWQNGRIVMSDHVSSGISAYPTRRGTFHIYRKYLATRMHGPGYNLPKVPYTMYYSGNFAVHGAYWHDNFGHPMSHGCVNLPVAFARSLYLWAPVGTAVVIR